MRLLFSTVFSTWFFLTALFLASCEVTPTAEGALRVAVSFDAERFGDSLDGLDSLDSLDGRVYLILAKENEREPRFQVRYGPKGQQIFGIDVIGMSPVHELETDGCKINGCPNQPADRQTTDYLLSSARHRTTRRKGQK